VAESESAFVIPDSIKATIIGVGALRESEIMIEKEKAAEAER
jgi:hypothetical protein